MKYIAIFCSASDIDEKYIIPAQEFANKMAKQGYNLVWGGSDVGLMKIIATEFQKEGRKIVGVSMDTFRDVARIDADEMIHASSLGERKTTMLMRSDGIVILVGGVGTLDESMEVIELKKQHKHDKPIVVLNTDNFYQGLKFQLHKMRENGFINRELVELVYFADTPDQAVDYMNEKLK